MRIQESCIAYLEGNLIWFKMVYVEDSFKDEFAVLFFNKRRIHGMLDAFLLLLLRRLQRQKFVRIHVVHCHLHSQISPILTAWFRFAFVNTKHMFLFYISLTIHNSTTILFISEKRHSVTF